MAVIRDIFFANVPGNEQENFHLDLYLPETSKANVEHYTGTKSFYIRKSSVSDTVCGSVETNIEDNAEYDNESDIITETQVSAVDNYDVWYSETDVIFEDEIDVNPEEVNQSEVGSSTLPLVIFVHGGGWRRGDKDGWKHYLYFDVNFLMVLCQCIYGTYSNVGHALSENGIACAIISYPLTEIGLFGLLIEMLSSYIQSCVAVVLTSLPFIALAAVFRTVFISHHFGSWIQIFHEHKHVFLLKECVLLVMLVTNLTTMCLFSVRRRHYKLNTRHIRAMWIIFVAFVTIIHYSSHHNRTLYVVILTLVLNHYIILRRRLTRVGTTYKDQMNVIVSALKWAKSLGHTKGIFDTTQIFMMGHSAGGHLVSLTVLDDTVLSTAGCSPQDIKRWRQTLHLFLGGTSNVYLPLSVGGTSTVYTPGVISISGVYDLMCLRGPFLRFFYLVPTFGNIFKTWISASPTHVIKNRKPQGTISKFLLLCAERDLFLKQQSWQFSEILQEAEVDCRHIEIEGTNHFSIITKFKRGLSSSDFYVLKYVSHFIHTGQLFDKCR